MAQGSGLIKLALFGSPVSASLSPRIHRLFAGQFGFELEYQRFDTTAAGFSAALADFHSAGGQGCNVTLPLKRDAWKLATDSSPEVARAQAANTLLHLPTGWFAHNTDGLGLVNDLSINQGQVLTGQRILILGAGGAVAGILGSLLACKPREIMLVNRDVARAAELASRFNSAGQVKVTSWPDLPSHGEFNLVLNATSLGHDGLVPEITSSQFMDGALCYDLNYFKASQALKKHCLALDQTYVDGLGMLVEQAAESFHIWTGRRPQTEPVIAACRLLS